MKYSKIALSELNLTVGDGNYSSKYPKDSEFLDKGVPFLSASDFEGKKISFKNVKHISKEMNDVLTKGHIQKGDLLIVVRGNGVGKTGFVSHEIGPCNINAQLAFIRSNDDRLITEYLYYYLKNNIADLKNLSTGSAQPQLTITNLMKLAIFLPSIDEQKKIVKILSDIDEQILLNEKLELLRDTLLPKLINGEIKTDNVN